MSPDRNEYVLRALAASELAATCTEPQLQASFFTLAEHWLSEAEAQEAPEGRQGQRQLQESRAHVKLSALDS